VTVILKIISIGKELSKMAEIFPFKGILYNERYVDNLADVVTPPYDVITPQEQDNFYHSHPNNMIRLILGKTQKNDTDENNPHTRAAKYFKKWLNDGILKKDDKPAIYLKSIAFEWNQTQYVRYGIIAVVRIEPFEKGVILPHEKTYSQVKSERLELMKTCYSNFDPIFALFPDKNNLLPQLIREIKNKKPDINFADHFGKRHFLWRLTDPALHNLVSDRLAPESLFIADGHHRYETALNFRKLLLEKNAMSTANHPANFVLMYLSSMQDPGLIILPAHRLIKNISQKTVADALVKSRDYFDQSSFPFNPASLEKTQTEFIHQLENCKFHNAIGILHKDQSVFYLLKLKQGVMDKLFKDSIPTALKHLDVIVLTKLIFMNFLGFNQNQLDDEQFIGYCSQEKDAINKVISKEYDAAFILNPTKIEQVRAVALNHLTMPRKSTYFYPKVISGLVQNSLKT
jgi:uncharacterized protein (DUF1015 family)